MRRAVLVGLPLSVLLLAACSGGVGDPSPSTSEDPTVALTARDAFVAAEVGAPGPDERGDPDDGQQGEWRDRHGRDRQGHAEVRRHGDWAGAGHERHHRRHRHRQGHLAQAVHPDLREGRPGEAERAQPRDLLQPRHRDRLPVCRTTGDQQGEQVRDGQDVLDVYTATVPGGQVRNLLRVGDATKTYRATFGVAWLRAADR